MRLRTWWPGTRQNGRRTLDANTLPRHRKRLSLRGVICRWRRLRNSGRQWLRRRPDTASQSTNRLLRMGRYRFSWGILSNWRGCRQRGWHRRNLNLRSCRILGQGCRRSRLRGSDGISALGTGSGHSSHMGRHRQRRAAGCAGEVEDLIRTGHVVQNRGLLRLFWTLSDGRGSLFPRKTINKLCLLLIRKYKAMSMLMLSCSP